MLKKDLASGVRATCPPGPPHDFFSVPCVSSTPGGYGRFLLKIKFFHDLAYMIGMMLDAEGAEDEGGHARCRPALGRPVIGGGSSMQELLKGVQLRRRQTTQTARARRQ